MLMVIVLICLLMHKHYIFNKNYPLILMALNSQTRTGKETSNQEMLADLTGLKENTRVGQLG